MSFGALGFLLGLAPLFALLVLLITDRYPGVRAIERLHRLIHSPGHPRTAPRARTLFPRLRPVQGGRLIACSLAGRGPPEPA